MSQEIHTFNGTLRDNLTILPLRTMAATDGDLLAAIELVDTGGLLRLPHGLDTMIGEAGHSISPAAAQMIALTRAFLADAELVILDEATAEADSTDAAHLDGAAVQVFRGRAGVVIAHRLSQAATADHIAIIEDGRIVERGSHVELIRTQGAYADLWNAWTHRADAIP